MDTPGHTVDVAVVGGGQAGLATGYFLRRARVEFTVLDDGASPGGAWNDYWDSLRLFSPAAHSPLPGWWMPEEEGVEFPSAAHVVRYLSDYERRYDLPVRRPVPVTGIHRADGGLKVQSTAGTWHARHVVSATGTWRAPYVPEYPGGDVFGGRQWHAADYRRPEDFAGQRVVVVGGGNSAAQILAELSETAHTTWVTRRPPRFMPDDVDGRVLFDLATRRVLEARVNGRARNGPGGLGDIVMVPGVREARDRGVLKAQPMFERLSRTGAVWADGSTQECDAVLWCTGFRPLLDHLAPLDVFDGRGRIPVDGTRSVREPRLHLVGYGDWTGAASATLVGAGRTAKAAVARIVADLRDNA